MKKNNQKKWIALSLILVLICIVFHLLITRQMTVPFLYRMKAGQSWTLGTIQTTNPLVINKDSICVINWDIVPEHPPICFMADPFVVENEEIYYIFYEHYPPQMNSTWGDIGVLKSTDLTSWEYIGIALDEPFHLSYPYVFKWNDKWYMIPETSGANQIRLYETDKFPCDWKLKTVLIENRKIADATLLIKDGFFYLLAFGHQTSELCLFYSDNIEKDWKEHPASPIRNYDTRPGGTPCVVNESLIYFIQDHTHGYGTGLLAYEIDSISPTVFKDRRLDENNPVLYRFGDDWAATGMHQLSSIMLNDSVYFCVVDGNSWRDKSWGFDIRNLPKFRFK